MKFETKAIHVGQEPEKSTGATIVPIYQTSTFTHLEFGKHRGYEYSRTGNPTRQALEDCLASLENGKYGLAFASGLAATNAIVSLINSGDHVVVFEEVYGGTYRLFKKMEENYNIDFSYVGCEEAGNLQKYITPKTKLVWFETPTNPQLSIIDIKKVSSFCKKRNLISVLDNTFATPYFQRPLDLGIDIALHSTTKYIAGHSDVIGGAIVTNNEKYYEQIKFFQNAAGGTPGPFDCWLVLRGLKTLAIRMKQHEENALKIAKYLEAHKNVKKVFYPGLKKYPYYELAKNQMSGFSGMVTFEFDEDLASVKKFLSKLRLFSLAESLGGVESLVCHPATMTHASFPTQERLKMNITDSLIRLSVGIEDAADLIEDLDNAFKK